MLNILRLNNLQLHYGLYHKLINNVPLQNL